MCIILNTSYLIGGVRFREKGAMKKKKKKGLPTRGLLETGLRVGPLFFEQILPKIKIPSQPDPKKYSSLDKKKLPPHPSFLRNNGLSFNPLLPKSDL